MPNRLLIRLLSGFPKKVPNRLLQLFSEFPAKVPNQLLWLFPEFPHNVPNRLLRLFSEFPISFNGLMTFLYCASFVCRFASRAKRVRLVRYDVCDVMPSFFCRLLTARIIDGTYLPEVLFCCCCCCCCFPPGLKSLVYVLLVLFYLVFFSFFAKYAWTTTECDKNATRRSVCLRILKGELAFAAALKSNTENLQQLWSFSWDT